MILKRDEGREYFSTESMASFNVCVTIGALHDRWQDIFAWLIIQKDSMQTDVFVTISFLIHTRPGWYNKPKPSNNGSKFLAVGQNYATLY